MTDMINQLKLMKQKLNKAVFTEPYKTKAGISCLRRDNIAAFTTINEKNIEVHLKSGTIFTIQIQDNQPESVVADLMGFNVTQEG
tara:strand:+ start:239 stop:493 length:255 start_codon:yes stop_codon:yes gene_type:complete